MPNLISSFHRLAVDARPFAFPMIGIFIAYFGQMGISTYLAGILTPSDVANLGSMSHFLLIVSCVLLVVRALLVLRDYFTQKDATK